MENLQEFIDLLLRYPDSDTIEKLKEILCPEEDSK